MCKNRGIYGFLGTSWVLTTYNICPPVIVAVHTRTIHTLIVLIPVLSLSVFSQGGRAFARYYTSAHYGIIHRKAYHIIMTEDTS